MTSKIIRKPAQDLNDGVGRAGISMLNPDDVCDRCGARAYVLALFESGGELTFCGHHAHHYRHQLAQEAFLIHDETAQLAVDARGAAA